MPLTDAAARLASTTLCETPEFFEDPLIGRVIQDRYRIRRMIGRGGMGIVYEAQHLLIGRTVALKTMAAHTAVSTSAIERFRREAQAAAAVGNSHVVDVLDMGQLDGGSLYIVLEHLDGSALGFSVASSGPFTAARARNVLVQLCDALSAVHAAGIVHRDLKPDNVFLILRDGQRDFVKVLDFGVCKFVQTPGVALTNSKDMVGTPQFMAPEQVDGRPSDHRSDIHALGAILFFVLTGRPPYSATTLPRLFQSICKDAPPSVRALRPELPEALDAVLRQALEKDPHCRFQSCEALKTALMEAFGAADEFSATLVARPAGRHSGVFNDSAAALARALESLRARNLRPIAFGAAAALVIAAVLGRDVGSHVVRDSAATQPSLAKRSSEVSPPRAAPLAMAVATPAAAPTRPEPATSANAAPLPRQRSVRPRSPAAIAIPSAVPFMSGGPSKAASSDASPSASAPVTLAPPANRSPAPPTTLNPQLKDGRF